MQQHTQPASAWDIDETAFPRDASLDARAWFAVRYALLAPSSHNSQPWRFQVEGGTISLLADRTRGLPVTDPYDRELIISCGAALLNLRAALAHFGMGFTIDLFPAEAEPDLLARVHLDAAAPVDKGMAHLFPAICRRATNRTPFTPIAVPDKVRDSLCAEAAVEGVAVRPVTTTAQLAEVAALIAQADRQQFDDVRFRRELASWIHPHRASDGMPAYAFGVPRLMDFDVPITSMVIRTFDLGGGIAAHDAAVTTGSPLLLCFSTTRDDAPSWLFAGQALERLLLLARLEGYDASYLNQPIEVPELRNALRDALGTEPFPQLLIRLGRGQAVAHTPRRPLEETVL
jgi:hypothetical protein